jgi:hypothetical protein
MSVGLYDAVQCVMFIQFKLVPRYEECVIRMDGGSCSSYIFITARLDRTFSTSCHTTYYLVLYTCYAHKTQTQIENVLFTTRKKDFF